MIIPTIRQIQVIADILNTSHVPDHIDPDEFSEPWIDYLYWCIDRIDGRGAMKPDQFRYELFNRWAGMSDEHHANYKLIAEAMDTPTLYPPAVDSLANVDDLRWVWKGWLLRGLPSLLAAVPGTGKSYLALDLAHRIITGTQFPDGTPVERSGPVLYVDAENTPVIHKERVSVWPPNALQQLYIMLPDQDRFVINLDDYPDRDRLRDMAWVIRPELIIIDSYGSCTLKGENNKEDVQGLLAFFNQLAAQFDCSLLIIHHLRKGASGQTSFVPMSIDSIRGSSHIAAMARHIWGLQFVPTANSREGAEPRRMWIMKTNVGPPPDAIGVDFAPHPANPDVAQIMFGAAPEPAREPTRTEECAEWILCELEAAREPVRPADIVQAAEADGFTRAMVYRARKDILGDAVIDTQDSKYASTNCWALPEYLEIDE